MPPRRSHTKSRAGCRRCKARKIKCDEIRPRCRNCDRHGVPCDYEFPELAGPRPAPSFSSMPGGPPTPGTEHSTLAGGFHPLPLPYASSLSTQNPSVFSPSSTAPSRLLELRLLHHYVVTTSKTLNVRNDTVEKVWQDLVPRMAFAASCGSVNSRSSHLTDAVLAVSALHLRSEFPHDQELVNASHAYMASSLGEYNRLLRGGIDVTNAEAMFVNATLIAFQSTAARIFNKEEPQQPGTGMTWGGGGDSSSSSAYRNRHVSGSGGRDYTTGYVFSDGSASVNMSVSENAGSYGLPLSWFHAFQGVKTVTAASWAWLRSSDVALPIINAQPPLHLNLTAAGDGFFGHLLDGLDDELAPLTAPQHRDSSSEDRGPNGVMRVPVTYVPSNSMYIETTVALSLSQSGSGGGSHDGKNAGGDGDRNYNSSRWSSQNSAWGHTGIDEAKQRRHAYQHAVAVLNWAHRIPQTGACLAFPATVSRSFVDLLSRRTPRSLCILACFFAMTKVLDSHWWLRGMARREVLGIVSLFNSDAVPADVERLWWPHLLWAVRVAVYHEDGHPSDYVPADVWNAPYAVFANAGSDHTTTTGLPAGMQPPPAPGEATYGSHIDLISHAMYHGDSITPSSAAAAAAQAAQFNAYPGII